MEAPAFRNLLLRFFTLKRDFFLCEFWDICGTSTIVTDTHVVNTPKNELLCLWSIIKGGLKTTCA